MSQIVENPRGGCVLAGILSSLSAIDKVCPIFHSGPGCCMQTTAAEQGQSGNKSCSFVSGVSLPSSNMLEKEVVFGGLDKLRTTIQGSVDIIDADAYFVLTGCTAGIIGDDIDSVVSEFREKGEAVYAINTPGFAGDSNLGYEAAWNILIDEVIAPPADKDERLVNIFGIIPYHDPFWSGNLEEISRILSRLGLKVNTFYTNGQNINDVKESSNAALNIVINPWIFKKPAEKFEEKFGVPYIRVNGLPIGATDTSLFVRQVSDALGIDKEVYEKVITEEENYVYGYLGKAIGALSFKKFAVVADASNAIGFTRYLANDYSFWPELVVITEPIYRESDKERIVAALTDLEYASPPQVVFEPDQHEINKGLEAREEITLIIGSSNEAEVSYTLGAQLLVAAFQVKDRLILNRAYAGYRGSLSFTEDLYDNL